MFLVKNSNSFDFEGRYASIDYRFPAGKSTAIPDDAARHIFGVGDANKTDVLVRNGWVTTSSQHQLGLDILNKFSFNVADELIAGEIIDAPRLSASKGKEQGSAPLQKGSGGEAKGSDGLDEQPPQPTIFGGSILDTLESVAGG